jgi:hypothetical protein
MFVDFFRDQFDELQPDEVKNIRDGFVSNCDTIYIAGYNSSEQKSPQILAAIQYSCTPSGSWINWLGHDAFSPRENGHKPKYYLVPITYCSDSPDPRS